MIKFGNARLTYELDSDILAGINIIFDDSATGKTALCDTIDKVYKGTPGFFSNENLFNLPVMFGKDMVSRLPNEGIVVIDEDCELLRETGIESLLLDLKCKVILISRDLVKFRRFSISIDNVLQIKNSGKFNTIVRKYKDCNLSSEIKPNTIITEDSKSGYKFLKQYFNGIDIVSAHGKDNISSLLARNINSWGNKTILIVLDRCAFGLRFEELIGFQRVYKNLYFITWECFEEYLLRSDNIKQYYRKCGSECDYYSLLASCIDYNKDSISHCISLLDTCNTCSKLQSCNCCSFKDRRELYIHDELKYVNVEECTMDIHRF